MLSENLFLHKNHKQLVREYFMIKSNMINYSKETVFNFSGTENLYLAVLHPRKLAVYSVTGKSECFIIT